MGEMDTLCGECRAQLETHVMAVSAADYPEPEAKTSEPTDDLGVPIAAAMDPQLAAAVAQDPELLPLAPLDEARVGALAAGTASSLPSPSAPKLSNPPQRPSHPVAPVSRPTPPVPVVERPVVLNPTSRWKPIILAIICIGVCAVLAGVIWSFIVPRNTPFPVQPGPTTTRSN